MRYITLKNGEQTIVDDDVYEWASKCKWHLHSLGYVSRTPKWKGPTLLMHREITGAKKDEVVDHINGNKLDNRRENLRVCKQSENSRNRVKSTRNTSGYKGVDWSKKYNKWRSRIKVNYKEIHLGMFDSKEEAAKAYNEAAIKYFGKYSKLNEVK